ncbi:MAG: phospho-N-acetylmuramoyl-pentapeptide-transferase [Clostridia bacterium]
MKTAVAAMVISFLIAVIIGMPIIKYLAKLKFGQKILEIGPKWHMNKQYTPTMGGIIFIISIIITNLLLTYSLVFIGEIKYIALLIFSIAFGLIGFLDDYTKVVKKRNLGLTASQKLVLQIAASILFISALRIFGLVTPNVYIPFVNAEIPVPWILFLAFAVFVVVGCTNAVNLTDGIDGLATSVTIPVCIFFMLVAIRVENYPVMIFAGCLVGSLIGFLIFNYNPAKVFMGDTGSLFLGGAVVSMAFALDLPLILIPVGIIYIYEAISVILQVSYFKITGGKRLFKMAPVHHHYEMKGYTEKQIGAIFTLITIVMCVISYKFGLEMYLKF